MDPDLPSGTTRQRDLLDSWKDIASYLGRSVRAVQTWEKEEGLPVHRHLHEKQGSVYAYKSDLDAWLQRRSAAPAAAAKPYRRWMGLAGALAGAAILALALWWMGWESRHSEAVALPFRQQDSVLVAALENRTGEPVFDGSVEYLLERELSESSFVDVASRERVADVLRLMQRNEDTVVDRVLAREIALRDGAIRAIVAARLEKLGGAYVLGVDLLHPSSGQRAAAFTAEAVNHDEIARATRKLADRVREALGERKAAAPARTELLERVTSPSLRAVQLFTQADRLIAFENDPAAERLLLQAIEEDPNFASAHMHLAFAKMNQRKPRQNYLPHAERAVNLAASTTDRERYFIFGSHALMIGNHEEALAHYKALLQIDPNHFWATNNIGTILKFRLGRPVEAIPYRVRTAELRPNQFAANFQAAESLAHWAGRPEEARTYFRRAAALIRPEDETHEPLLVVLTRLYGAQEAWLNGDLATVVRELDAWKEAVRTNPGPSADLLMENIGYFELAIGRGEEAGKLVERIRQPAARTRYAAHLALARGDRPNARARFEELLALGGEVSDLDLLRAVQSGSSRTVEKVPGRASRSWSSRQIIRGEMALARGDRKAAIELYRDGLRGYGEPGARILPFYLAAVESLARALEAEGRLDQAITLIKDARKHQIRVPPQGMPQWMTLQHQLLRLYSKTGDAKAVVLQSEIARAATLLLA